jgi:hypothetical protein
VCFVSLDLNIAYSTTNILLFLLGLTDWCQDVGIYEFTMGATGDKVKGRYTFVYVWEDGQWKISHHHSSVMPEAFLGPSPKPAVAKTVPKTEAKEEEKEPAFQ